jgi:O-antigen/teichoic acid export membrane protein
MYKMRDLFSHFIPLIYSLISFLVIFISVNGEKIALLFGGNEYFQSKEAISIMVLYPMHQTYGQLSGSIFFATGQTKLYRNIGVIFMLVSLPLTYILLAPSSSFGFGLGATGLSIKMVAIQFIAVNVQLFYNAKFLRISFFKLFSHQIYTAVIFVIIAYFSSFIANNIYTNKIIISIFINIIIYVILSMCLLFSFPFIFSLTRKELNKYIILLKNKNPFKIS